MAKKFNKKKDIAYASINSSRLPSDSWASGNEDFLGNTLTGKCHQWTNKLSRCPMVQLKVNLFISGDTFILMNINSSQSLR